ncbi:MAG: iron ABC transporter permease [Candidatus Omnitrophica bacterium]|nr:iron ABC transporter permease [Candidatus Omnitrophota bacterium]MBU4478520.1 iron ABC transporter permease [Candidatus Omnitrophota bacterium]MCG2702942.1 iron ABC transporter permease [Candidatus Omnitrophota bacterium]
MNRRYISWLGWVIILLLVLGAVSAASLCVGASRIPLHDVWSFILGRDTGTAYRSILLHIRLPRILLGIVVGGALSIAGVVLQGMFRNPLVEPYTLGISGGAALGVCFSIVTGMSTVLGAIALPLAGFCGAVFAVVFVYFLSRQRGMLKLQGLLLSGVMVSFICSSLVMLIMSVMRTEDLHGIIFWIMGSLEEPNWMLIKITAAVSIAGLVTGCAFWKELNAFSLGEEGALHLGVNTQSVKKILFLLASLLTGASVAVSGVIGFVGLAIPHFVRLFIGSDHRAVMICSYLLGAAFLVACDTLARTIIAPLELPVGVITGIIGGSIFIYALCSRRPGA